MSSVNVLALFLMMSIAMMSLIITGSPELGGIAGQIRSDIIIFLCDIN